MQSLNEKNRYFKSSRIREMTILSNQYGAINLAQGFPEFDPPKALTEKLRQIASLGDSHQYAPNWGIDALRERIAEKEGRGFGRALNPQTEILVTCGSTEAMICAQMALFNPGEKLAVFSPYYNSYEANALITGAEPLYVELDPPDF
ncbi:MAG: aminotransferase class I/II-fold pyridoxal phosphate-dependent enzyme, partial [Clostridia bacterium]|nr:aminotransferase class I/II-fold pyridoxal phosphate-dependent enzyme [Clostridia bacterium]